MSMTYHDKILLAPRAKPKRATREAADDHGIGHSPRFASGWWLAATAVFYVAVALACILILI